MSKVLRMKTGEWDLSELLRDPIKKVFNKSLDDISAKVAKFEEKKPTLGHNISIAEFIKLIKDSEEIAESLSYVTGYAHLKYAENTSSNDMGALVTKVNIFATEISNKLLFFDLWFKKVLDEKNANRLIKEAPDVYKDYLLHERSMSKYTLNEAEEKIVNILDVTGMSALIKIYDRMTNGFEFEYVEERGTRKIRKIITNKEKLISLVRSSKSSERVAAYKIIVVNL